MRGAEVEAEVAACFDAKTLDEEKMIVRRLNKAALDNVVYAPLGLFLPHQAWRKNVSGIVTARNWPGLTEISLLHLWTVAMSARGLQPVTGSPSSAGM